MSRHVELYFSALIEGRLHPVHEARIRQHIASCDKCRYSLEGFERLTADMNLTLRFGIHASNRQVMRWWDNISQEAVSQPRPWATTTILPALLSAILVAAPLVLRLFNNYQQPFAQISGTTVNMPSVDSTNVPLFHIAATAKAGQQVATMPETDLTPPVVHESTPVPLIPAPMAPVQP